MTDLVERLCNSEAPLDDPNLNDEAAEEIKALRKDAARYRWLLENRVSENDEGEKCIYYWCSFEHYDNVSTSIDAAMGAKR